MQKLKGIIFDLDGTLLDTIEDISNAVNTVLIEYGLTPYRIEDYKLFVGDGIEQLVERVLGKEIKREKFNEIFTKIKETYGNNWNIKTKPYPNILEMLDKLNTKNIKMAVISNKPHKFTMLTIEYYFGKKYFSSIYGASDNYPKKPDPFLAYKVLENFNLNQKDVAYLGDSNTDIIFAKNAGLLPFGASWGFRGEKELKENGALYTFCNPLEVLEFF